MFNSILPHTKDAARYYDEMRYTDDYQNIQRMFLLYEDLPISVRELITLPTAQQLREMGFEGADIATLAGIGGTGIAWWETQAEVQADTKRGEWFAAALRGLDRQRERERPDYQEPDYEEDEPEEDTGFQLRGL